MDKTADFKPKSIQILEKRTGLSIGQYGLLDDTQIESLCSNLMKNPNLTFYETVLIDYSDLPKGCMTLAYQGDYIFRIEIEHSLGEFEIIERTTPDDGCDTHVA